MFKIVILTDGSVKQVMLPKKSDKKQRLFASFVKIV
jgi:hypothetical protein